MCFALDLDPRISSDTDSRVLSEVQQPGTSRHSVADPCLSASTDEHRKQELSSSSDNHDMEIDSGDAESTEPEMTQAECTDVALYAPRPWKLSGHIPTKDEAVATNPQVSVDKSGLPDADLMDVDLPESIGHGGAAVVLKDETTTLSSLSTLVSAIPTEDQPVDANYDGAQDGTMSIKSILKETCSRRMMRPGIEPNAVDDNVMEVTTEVSAGQPPSHLLSPVTTALSTLSPVQDVSEIASTPKDVDAMPTDFEEPAVPVTQERGSIGPTLALLADVLLVDPAVIDVIDGIIAEDETVERIVGIGNLPESTTVTSPIDLITPGSDATSSQTPPPDIRKTSAVVRTDEEMEVDKDEPVVSQHVVEKTVSKAIACQDAASIGSKASNTTATEIEASRASGGRETSTSVAASLKRRAPEPASRETPAKKPKPTAPTPPAKTMSSAAAKKNALGGTAKTTARVPASNSASQSAKVVMIDSGLSTPASESATQTPKPIAAHAKGPVSAKSSKPTGTTISAVHDSGDRTMVSATPKLSATVANTKKPATSQANKKPATPSVAGEDEDQVITLAKSKPKTAAAATKKATQSKPAKTTATPSVVEADGSEDKDDKSGSEVSDGDIQTPVKKVCKTCQTTVRKELKTIHDKAIAKLRKDQKDAYDELKKKYNGKLAELKSSQESKLEAAAESHETALEKLRAKLKKTEVSHTERAKGLKDKHETKVASLTADRDELDGKRKEADKALATAVKNHKEEMQSKENKLKEETRKIKLAKKAEVDDMKPELNAAMRDKMKEIRELTVNKERLEKALWESTADAEAQSKAAEKWQMDYTASERRKGRADKKVKELKDELDAIRKSGLGPRPDIRAMREDFEDEIEEMRGRVDRARRNEVESGNRVVEGQRSLFAMQASNERHKAKAVEAEGKAAKAELENKVLRGILARSSGGAGGRADVEMSG
ncbi:hypothetical protein LTR95_007114 [Oleoguttula sp. CCFEE 5521]